MHTQRSTTKRQPSIEQYYYYLKIEQIAQHKLSSKHTQPKMEAQKPQQSTHRLQIRPQSAKQLRYSQLEQQHKYN
jgi:oligoribonuclease (3'-5' exoribonuclease)